MTKYNAKTEAEITKAITYYLETLGVKKSKIISKFLVPYSLFIEHLKDYLVQNTKGDYNTTLTIIQKDEL